MLAEQTPPFPPWAAGSGVFSDPPQSGQVSFAIGATLPRPAGRDKGVSSYSGGLCRCRRCCRRCHSLPIICLCSLDRPAGPEGQKRESLVRAIAPPPPSKDGFATRAGKTPPPPRRPDRRAARRNQVPFLATFRGGRVCYSSRSRGTPRPFRCLGRRGLWLREGGCFFLRVPQEEAPRAQAPGPETAGTPRGLTTFVPTVCWTRPAGTRGEGGGLS